ncbi:MAG: hypothetical protein CMF41_01850 [Legionellales bacterium]|nr:hypothetical protein [Legionellales bacterium]OUX65896.1 MAG: hypothetical protein CBE41_01045 [Gammaproteobacteria bacterium TMED281]
MTQKMKKFNVIIYAPNIKVGGGLILLKELIGKVPKSLNVFCILNEEVKENFPDQPMYTVSSSIFGRIKAELLVRRLSHQAKSVFCFHGVPTLLKTHCKQSVYIQNALLVDSSTKKNYSLFSRLRLYVESNLIKFKLHNMAYCYVQTRSMEERLRQFCKKNHMHTPKILIAPFIPTLGNSKQPLSSKKDIDFIYPADAQPHKNLRNLFLAWQILAEDNIRPSLVVTLDDQSFKTLKKTISFDEMKVNIINLGMMRYEDLKKVYQRSCALIFPSFLESFGLPLIEASQMGLQILASEKNFVYDVCSPSDTFDPHSAKSIAVAVKKFKGITTKSRISCVEKDFWKTFMSKEKVEH